MPPEPRFVIRFAAEPPQEGLPYGRWAEQLQAEFLAACLRVETEGEEIGEPGEITWFPDRTYGGRTYVPATARTSAGFELFGHVSFGRDEDGEPADFDAGADFTGETAEANPDWQIDLCDEVVGSWRGEHGGIAAMTLVWGTPLVRDGAIATAELKEFVRTLPQGLDTIVSERGTSLSGGQQQRIMLARALALNPRVLLLDDFTARVDLTTERQILANVRRNYPGLTLISVTQKIAPVEDYDQIVLLMEGEVLASGTHQHLMATSPEYVQIYDSQRSTSHYELLRAQ